MGVRRLAKPLETLSFIGNSQEPIRPRLPTCGAALNGCDNTLSTSRSCIRKPKATSTETKPVFVEWVEPQGIIDSAGIAIAREPSLLGYVSFGRSRSAGDIGEAEIQGLRILGPHFRRAVTISNLFDMKAIEALSFSSALDAMSLGAILVDEAAGIVHANAAAEAMPSEADPIQSVQGIVALPAKAANDALLSAVERAARDELALGQRGIGIPARRKTGEACVVHVLPLRRGELRRGVVQRAAAAVFIAPASMPSQLPTDALALLYDLTPAESRILELAYDASRKTISLRGSASPKAR
jgi:PAS domain-containing protein